MVFYDPVLHPAKFMAGTGGDTRVRLGAQDRRGCRKRGLILGCMMYRSGLMPRGLTILGLIGGSLICVTGLGVVLDVFARGGTAQATATVPEFVWELSLGVYPIVKGFKASPILDAAA